MAGGPSRALTAEGGLCRPRVEAASEQLLAEQQWLLRVACIMEVS